ncbi:TPA: hypothetical protein QDB15_002471 [Burkholderia vietnamiensis]|uniref:hypothetical protein n=1 Tax=Burkholderia TaxID=32008 RepID=UPI000975B9D1|nr:MULTISPECIES: hypothetical protein [Burkholderia]MCA8208272.1 hypothetical protein [Burkholderia vietnamiensis]HDR9099119.1 hypothetical protein [Burkholderia vietnamiensis]HDR9118696.1 hypothetical protein [Burkholderia vietnamiensis]HDR9167885.1 hypothetical protein [Burkholderia vietnamiensis]
MASIPGLWDTGPHTPVPVEKTWRDFVTQVGGSVIEDLIPQPRNFQNADFAFFEDGVIAELKEIETEFSNSQAFIKGFDELMQRVVAEDPEWRPALLGGKGEPQWFGRDFARLFRPNLARILKKANAQIKETKEHFKIKSNTGIAIVVNDGFASLGPDWVRALMGDILSTSYSSIDCCLYMTVNRYVEIRDSNVPRLVWAPMYSARASDDLVAFVNNLGEKWFDYIQTIIGPFTIGKAESQSESPAPLIGAKSIVLPR